MLPCQPKVGVTAQSYIAACSYLWYKRGTKGGRMAEALIQTPDGLFDPTTRHGIVRTLGALTRDTWRVEAFTEKRPYVTGVSLGTIKFGPRAPFPVEEAVAEAAAWAERSGLVVVEIVRKVIRPRSFEQSLIVTRSK